MTKVRASRLTGVALTVILSACSSEPTQTLPA